MTPPCDLRTKKRLATRQTISNAATQLFMARGFEHVTVDEIATAANVGRMTVFNHFPRKEDMFFDRDEEGRALLREVLRQRDASITPIETLRLLAHRLIKAHSPYVEFSAQSQRFIATVTASDTLKARARAIRDELTHVVAESLCETTGQARNDPAARLAAGWLLATWTMAFLEAHRIYQACGQVKTANTTFLDIIDQGTLGIKAAMTGTPYV